MSMPPPHIHFKDNGKPYAHHMPIPISFHWKSQVIESLDRDVERGIIEPVPIETSRMVQPSGQPKKWKAKKKNKSSASQLPMQQRSTPLPVTFLSSLPGSI